MSLIDRYLNAVRGYLPRDRQDDILRELSEDLHAQLADREEALGRAVTAEEEEQIVRKLGHPMCLAARYRPQRHVIGPLTFPLYWRTLQLALGAALLVHVGLAVASVAAGHSTASALAGLVAFPFGVAMTVFAWVTVIFALIDLSLPSVLQRSKWSPRQLAAGPTVVQPQWTLLVEIIASTAFLLWWLAVPRFPVLVFGPGAAFLSLGPVWQRMYAPVAGVWTLGIATLWALLLRPDWARFRAIGRLLTDGLALAIAGVILGADRVVLPAPGITMTADIAGAISVINAAIRLSALVTVLAMAWQIVRTLTRGFPSRPTA